MNTEISLENKIISAPSIVSIRNLRSFRDVVEIFSKIIFTSIGLLYIFGFIILNNYLRNYGVQYLNFLQIEYIMVGILFFSIFAECFLGLFIFYYIVNHICDNKLYVDVLDSWYLFFTMIFVVMTFFNLSTRVVYIFKNYEKIKSDKEGEEEFKERFYAIMFYFVCFIVAVSSYSKYVFPMISPVYGGGKKKIAEFIVKKDKISAFNIANINLKDNKTAGPVDVVFEAHDFFVVTIPGSSNEIKSIRINKDLIDGAMYYPNK